MTTYLQAEAYLKQYTHRRNVPVAVVISYLIRNLWA